MVSDDPKIAKEAGISRKDTRVEKSTRGEDAVCPDYTSATLISSYWKNQQGKSPQRQQDIY